MKKSIQYFGWIGVLMISSCCYFDPSNWNDDLCGYAVFEETRLIPLNLEYEVNKTGQFVEPLGLSSSLIRDILEVSFQDSDFKVLRLELISSSLTYSREKDNTSASMDVNAAVMGASFDTLVLMHDNLTLPLSGLTDTVTTDPLKLNQYLDGKAVKDLINIITEYVTTSKDEQILFVLGGIGMPLGSNTHFKLQLSLQLTMVYEICRYVPIGQGIRPCSS
jgi:hypothetical protein